MLESWQLILRDLDQGTSYIRPLKTGAWDSTVLNACFWSHRHPTFTPAEYSSRATSEGKGPENVIDSAGAHSTKQAQGPSRTLFHPTDNLLCHGS